MDEKPEPRGGLLSKVFHHRKHDEKDRDEKDQKPTVRPAQPFQSDPFRGGMTAMGAGGFNGIMGEKGAGKKIIRTGDLVYLSLPPSRFNADSGVVIGDWNMRRVALEAQVEGGSSENWRFEKSVFRVCPKLSYVAQAELAALESERSKGALRSSLEHQQPTRNHPQAATTDNEEDTESIALKLQDARNRRSELANLESAQTRAVSEQAQNHLILSSLRRGEGCKDIKFGDVIQLEHVPSGLFISMQKSPAALDAHCQSVILEAEGSISAQFRIFPEFKYCTVGSPVCVGHGLLLSSTGTNSAILGTNGQHGGAHDHASERPDLFVRLPTVLKQQGPTFEVNGSTQQRRGFAVQLYYRPDQSDHEHLLTTLDKFRLYNPETHGFLMASANADKGETLDFIEGKEGSRLKGPTLLRAGGVIPAHIPYLKAEKQRDAKAVWAFEFPGRSEAGATPWERPLRLRHVASGKYLCVDSTNPVHLSEEGLAKEGLSRHTSTQSFDSQAEREEEVVYNAVMATDVNLDAKEGETGSASSLLFYLVSQDASSTTSVPSGVSTISIQHRTAAGATLFVQFIGQKPTIEGGPAISASDGEGQGSQESEKHTKGTRVLFSSKYSPEAALKLFRCEEKEATNLNRTIGRVALLSLYAHLYKTAPDLEPCVALAETLAQDIVHYLEAIEGPTSNKAHAAAYTNSGLLELVKLAGGTQHTSHFFLTWSSSVQDSDQQSLAQQTNMLNHLFDVALAPYNRDHWSCKDPFVESPNSTLLRAISNLVFVALDATVKNNPKALDAFSKESARLWKINPLATKTGLPNSAISAFSRLGKKIGAMGEDQEQEKKRPLVQREIDHDAHRESDLFNKVLVYMSEGSLGATYLLTMLIRSSSSFSSLPYAESFVELVRSLIINVGPEARFVGLLRSLCFVDGSPSRVHQELVVRKLWMRLGSQTRFAIYFDEHNVKETLPAAVEKFGEKHKLFGEPRRRIKEDHVKRSALPVKKEGKLRFLGDQHTKKGNKGNYPPVSVSWSSQLKRGGDKDWTGGSGALFWQPGKLGLPVVGTKVVGEASETDDGDYEPFQTVPVEFLLWPLEPEVCYEKVYNHKWEEADEYQAASDPAFLLVKRRRTTVSKNSFHKAKVDHEARCQLAEYTIAMIDLFVDMCLGRSSVVTKWLEQSFPYEVLVNLAANSRLPYRFRATVVRFICCLYVDRYPQEARSVNALWVASKTKQANESLLSSIPFIPDEKFNLEASNVFPVFSVSPLSSASKATSPVISHPDHYKFFLLRNLVQDAVKACVTAGPDTDVSRIKLLGEASLKCLSLLVKFGFMSTYTKLKKMAEICAKVLGDFSGKVSLTEMKIQATQLLLDSSQLATNCRLGLMLQKFKRRHLLVSGSAQSAQDYFKGATAAAEKALYDDFESIFSESDASKLALNQLCANEEHKHKKNDLVHDVIFNLMDKDDDLFASSLELLFRVYGQRLSLVVALENVMLLPDTKLPIFGDVHVFQLELSELVALLNSYSNWGIKSLVSGPFDDKAYNSTMRILHRLILFLSPTERAHAESEEEVEVADDTFASSYSFDGSYGVEMKSPTRKDEVQDVDDGLWSIDLAEVWSARTSSETTNCSTSVQEKVEFAQDLLKSCPSFLNLIIENVLGPSRLDPLLAWKGSICTNQEKKDSEHRLTMVAKGLLVLATAYIRNNESNQHELGRYFSELEDIASGDMIATRGEKKQQHSKSASKEFTFVKDSATLTRRAEGVPELARNLVQEMLKGNSTLAERVVSKSSLVKLFAARLALSPDISSDPALDFFLTITNPNGRPLRHLQNEIVKVILSSTTSHMISSIFQCLGGEIKHRSPPPNQLPNLGSTSTAILLAKKVGASIGSSLDDKFEISAKGISFAGNKEAQSPKWVKVKNPAQIVELVFKLIEGGNDVAWAELSSKAGLSLTSLCKKFCDTVDKALSVPRLIQRKEKSKGCDKSSAGGDEDTKKVAKSMAIGEASHLHNVLVEAILLRPQDKKFLNSESLWRYLKIAAEPVLAFYSSNPSEVDAAGLSLVEDLVDVVDHVLSSLVTKGLIEDARDPHGFKVDLLEALGTTCTELLEQRNRAPKEFSEKFSEALKRIKRAHLLTGAIDFNDSVHNKGLTKSEFVDCMVSLSKEVSAPDALRRTSFAAFNQRLETLTNSGTSASSSRDDSAKAAAMGELFDSADVDGDGLVDLPEAIDAIFDRKGPAILGLEKFANHRTSKRAGESARRIVEIASGEEWRLRARLHLRDHRASAKTATSSSHEHHADMALLDRILSGRNEGQLHAGNHNGKTLDTLQEKLASFKHALLGNPFLASKFRERRFELVDRLELGLSVNHGGLSGATQLTVGWVDITERFVAFVEQEILQGQDNTSHQDHTKIVLYILSIWLHHLQKSRSKDEPSGDGIHHVVKLVEPGHLAPLEFEAFQAKQAVLNKAGVTDLLVRILILLPPGDEGSISDMALELFSELLNGGNRVVQDTLLEILKTKDPEVKFLGHLAARLEHDSKWLTEARARGQLGRGRLTDDAENHVLNGLQTFRFTQFLCEGQNLAFQNILREQPKGSVQIDLVNMAISILSFMVESPKAVVLFSKVETQFVYQILDFLLETMLGPCINNQSQIACAEVLDAINFILASPPRPSALKAKSIGSMVKKLVSMGKASSAHVEKDLRARACLLLAACLEGRKDLHAHTELSRRLDTKALKNYGVELQINIMQMIHNSRITFRVLLESETDNLVYMQAALAAVITVTGELSKLEHLATQAQSARSTLVSLSADGGDSSSDEEYEENNAEKQRRRTSISMKLKELLNTSGSNKSGKATDNNSSDRAPKSAPGLGSWTDDGTLVATVEIWWRGQVEKVCFPLPIAARHLPSTAKAEFMSTVDLSTAEMRMTSLVGKMEEFDVDMNHNYEQSVKSPLFQLLSQFMEAFKLVMYGLVILMNLNVIMSPPSLNNPASTFYEYARGAQSLSGEETTGLFITLGLGFTNFVGYFVIMYHLGSIEVPISVKNFEAQIEEKNLHVEEYTDVVNAFTPWALTLFFNVAFWFMHSTHFEPNPSLYYFLFLGVNGPWTLHCIRNAIVVPTGPLARFQKWYCIVYEVVVTKPFFRNHVILQVFSILGFYDAKFFSLMLLDGMNNSSTLSAIIKSIISPGMSLMLVFYLFLISIVIYASFGADDLSEYLVVPTWDEESEESGDKQCSTTLGCFWFLFYVNLAGAAGDIRSNLRTVNTGSGDYLARVAYDSIFFVWVGIVILNIITGLMVDTFGAIREEAANRSEILETECFVCGMQRTDYDDLGLGKKAATFKEHQEREHDKWLYVLYLAYLNSKDQTDHHQLLFTSFDIKRWTGIEAYVMQHIKEKSLEWVPARTSAAVEAHHRKAQRRLGGGALATTGHHQDGSGGEGAGGGGEDGRKGKASNSSSAPATEQLSAESYHHFNASLVSKLGMLTQEVAELKSGSSGLEKRLEKLLSELKQTVVDTNNAVPVPPSPTRARREHK